MLPKILVVDDDVDLLETTVPALEQAGFLTITARDGATALRHWQVDRPDLVLLDMWLPKVNGLEVCRQIHQESATPIIMLTSSTDEDNVVEGFRRGVDDYVTKPFSIRELVARIHAVLRRRSGRRIDEPVKLLHSGRYVIDVEAHQVWVGDEPIYLTPHEFRIFYMLAINEGHVVTFDRLSEYAWGYHYDGHAVLKTHVSHIRSKLHIEDGKPGSIRVVPRIGYTLERSSSAKCAPVCSLLPSQESD